MGVCHGRLLSDPKAQQSRELLTSQAEGRRHARGLRRGPGLLREGRPAREARMEGSRVGAGGDELREGERERSWGLHRAPKGTGSHVGGLTALLSCN